MLKLKKYWIPAFAIAGILFGISFIVASKPQPKPKAPAMTPTASPYKDFVAGSGIIETSSRNISVRSELSGIVQKVYVQVGQSVKAGTPLFKLDDRARMREHDLKVAAVRVSEASLNEAKANMEVIARLPDQRAVSKDEVNKRRFALQSAAARLGQTKAELAQVNTDLLRLIVTAPIAGEILQINISPGEYSASGASTDAPIIMGRCDPLYVRIDVDEMEAWRLKAGAEATMSLRGQQKVTIPLSFVRFEPYVVPKKSLTGSSNEKTDTRVLQVIYSFPRGGHQVFVGQQIDAFIRTDEGGSKKP